METIIIPLKEIHISSFTRELSAIMSINSSCIKNFCKIARCMKIEESDIAYLENEVMNIFPHVDLFNALLGLWVTKEGQHATLNRLVSDIFGRIDGMDYDSIKLFIDNLQK